MLRIQSKLAICKAPKSHKTTNLPKEATFYAVQMCLNFQDVLSEIQRLKEEANRFIAILAAEDEEEEEMSPQKRQNLTREVESLQVISNINILIN